MKRKQVYIEAEQEKRLKSLAKKRGVSEAVLVREALDAYLEVNDFKGFERIEDHPLWGLVGLATSEEGPTDGSVNHDHYIYGVPKKYRVNEDGSIERIL
jgi:hypothetical protein